MRITMIDISKMFAIMKIEYPGAIDKLTEEQYKIKIALWYEGLKEYPYEFTKKAFAQVIAGCTFCPKLSDIIYRIKAMYDCMEKSDAELFENLKGILWRIDDLKSRLQYTAICDDGQSQGEKARICINQIYQNLSPILQAYCGSMSGLISMSGLNKEEMEFERGRFLKIAPRLRERETEKAELSSEMRKMIGNGIKSINE